MLFHPLKKLDCSLFRQLAYNGEFSLEITRETYYNALSLSVKVPCLQGWFLLSITIRDLRDSY